MARHAEKKRRDRGDDGISWDVTTGASSARSSSAPTRPASDTAHRDRQDESAGQVQAGQVTRGGQGRASGLRRPTPWSNASATGSTHSRSMTRPSPSTGGRPRNGSIRRSERPSSNFHARDVERFFNDCGRVLSKRSLVGLKHARRSIRRAQRHDLIGRILAAPVDLPEGQPDAPPSHDRAPGRHRAQRGHPRPTGFVPWSRSATTARPPPTPPPKPTGWPAAPGRARTPPSTLISRPRRHHLPPLPDSSASTAPPPARTAGGTVVLADHPRPATR